MEVMGAGKKVSGGSEVKDTEVWSCTLVRCTFPFVDIYPHLSMHAAGEWKGTSWGQSSAQTPRILASEQEGLRWTLGAFPSPSWPP